jgi:hypothetical protein
MDQKRFNEGLSLEAFLETMEGTLREKFAALLEDSRADVSVQDKESNLPNNLNVVVIAEPWSGDVLYNLPPLLALAEDVDWDVRIFPRDEYPELIENYMKDGIYRSIPVFIIYDAQFNEIGHWIERPAIATKTIDDESLALRRRLREANKAEWRLATLVELKELLGED